MINYYCLRLKNKTQWDNAVTNLNLDKIRRLTYDVIGDLYSSPGVKSDGYHVNIALQGRKLPERFMPYVVKPILQKRSFNGAGTHEGPDLEKRCFAHVPVEKIFGYDVTAPQLATLAAWVDPDTLPEEV